VSDGTSAPSDPAQPMGGAYAQAMERWSKAMEEIVGGPDFAAASGKLLAVYAQQQQAMRAASRIAAESMQMPTTEDLAEVARLVINVERKVDELTDQAAEVLTRVTAIETRLAEATATALAIPARLTAIEEAIGQLARRSADQVAEPAGTKEPAAGRASTPTSGVKKTSTTAKAPAAKAPAAAKGTRRRTPPADG
jgi:polyhydroxyalkanoic acid synthase PhaR subunit